MKKVWYFVILTMNHRVQYYEANSQIVKKQMSFKHYHWIICFAYSFDDISPIVHYSSLILTFFRNAASITKNAIILEPNTIHVYEYVNGILGPFNYGLHFAVNRELIAIFNQLITIIGVKRFWRQYEESLKTQATLRAFSTLNDHWHKVCDYYKFSLSIIGLEIGRHRRRGNKNDIDFKVVNKEFQLTSDIHMQT